jgi:23S rRNA pseudouridine1911/1915/1917 synthase
METRSRFPYNPQVRKWVADDEDAGERLDVVLVRRVPDMSRSKARLAVAAGEVTVNGRRARKGDRVEAGDRVALGVDPTRADFPARPDASLALVVVHEDPHVLVVDKAPGVPTHPLRPDELGTLTGALVARYPELAGIGYRAREPGIVHRLDTGTSGLVLVARDVATFDALALALRRGEIAKKYLALVAGAPAVPQEISLSLHSMKRDTRRVEPDRTRKRVVSKKGRSETEGSEREGSEGSALSRATHLISGERVGEWALLSVSAPRAGRHQIRAHLAAIGFPLAGDELYGGPPIQGLTRHFLHAAELAFTHPVTGARIAVASPLPPDLVDAVRTARAGLPG